MKRTRIKRFRTWLGAALVLAAAAVFALWFISYIPTSVKTPLTDEQTACAELEKQAFSGNEWVCVASNGMLELLLRPDTAEVAVRDLASGSVFHTNPQDRAGDPVARGVNASLLSSQLSVTYADGKNNISEINSYDMAVQNEQVGYYALEDGLKVFYLMRAKTEETIVPGVITREDMAESLLPVITDAKERSRVVDAYVSYSALLANQQKSAAALYPGIADAPGELVMKAEGRQLSTLKGILEKYITLEDKRRFEEPFGVLAADNMAVTASLEYRLQGSELVVTVPSGDVTCSEGYRVLGIRVLPQFGASVRGRTGYALVPDGSGALIRFTDKLRANASLSLDIYGPDASVANSPSTVKGQPVMLPVYGIVSEDRALMGVLEGGAALAALKVVPAGSVHNYNAVYPEYTLAANARLSLQAVAGDMPVRVYQLHPFMGDLSVRYFFLSGERADYSGMAAALRHYWEETGTLQKSAGGYALMIDLIMGIDKLQPFLGIPLMRVTPLTTFPQAEALLIKLRELGVSHTTLKLTGWQKGGANHGLQTSAEADPAVAAGMSMEAFMDAAARQGAVVYPGFGASTVDVEKAGWFSGVREKRDVVRTLRREPARLYRYNLPTGILDRARQMRFYLTDAKKRQVAAAYLGSLDQKGYNIAFEEMGAMIVTDYNPDRPVSRDEARQCDEELLQTLSEGRRAMGGAVYAYAFPYVDYIADVPATSKRLDIYDAQVPFVQMLLHGYRGYGIEYLNTSDISRDEMLLRILETGSEPAFQWIASDDEWLRGTEYRDYYSLNDDLWLEDAAELYRAAAEILAPLSGRAIARHDWLSDDVARVVYESGTQIFVNYGKDEYSAGGVTVPAKGYWVREGTER